MEFHVPLFMIPLKLKGFQQYWSYMRRRSVFSVRKTLGSKGDLFFLRILVRTITDKKYLLYLSLVTLLRYSSIQIYLHLNSD